MASRSLSRKNTADRQALSREVLRQVLADLSIALERHALHKKTTGKGQFYDEEVREMIREHVREKFPETVDCFEDFLRRNRCRSTVLRTYGDIAEIGFRTEPRLKELSRIDRRRWWDLFHEKFPDVAGTLSVSAVGFSENYCYAMVSVTTGVGPLHASGGTYLYRRDKETWTKVDVISMWMA